MEAATIIYCFLLFSIFSFKAAFVIANAFFGEAEDKS